MKSANPLRRDRADHLIGLQTRLVRSKDLGDTKLIVENESSQVKIEVNIVFRGTVLPVEYRSLSTRTSDLFDIWQLYDSGGLTEGMAECFTIYLAGHNRPPHEVLFGSDKDISAEYERAFVGMTEIECSLDTLLAARSRLRLDLPQLLTDKHKRFLAGRKNPTKYHFCCFLHRHPRWHPVRRA